MSKVDLELGGVSADELKKLMKDLRDWAWEVHGRSKEIATALDVTEETVSRWLNNRKVPSLKNYFALSAFWKRVNAEKDGSQS